MLEAVIQGQVGSLRIDVQLDTRDGALILVGPNGAGKTTLLLMLLGVVKARSGRIVVGDATLFDPAAGVDVAVAKRRIGYVPQEYALFPHMSVLENVAFALGSSKAAGDHEELRSRAQAMLSGVGLAGYADRRVEELSGGEKQKVALARALAVRPRALLLDEPLAALDVQSRREVRSFLASYLRTLAVPAVLVTHDPADAIAFGHRIAVLEGGRIAQTGTLDELRARPGSAFVEQFAA